MAYCPACGSPTDGAVRFCSECGEALPARAPGVPPPPMDPPDLATAAPAPSSAALPSPGGPSSNKRRLLIAGALIAAVLVASLAIILGRGSNEDAGHERVCAMTEEFWDIAESDEDRSELDRLLGIARQMGDGIDDDAEEEGFDDIAENATKAAIGASFADLTGDTEVVFTALDRLEVLCADLGLGGNASSEPVREVDAPSGEAPEAEVESMPRDRPVGIVIADESQARLPDDPFESLSCDLRERQTEGSGSATTALAHRCRAARWRSMRSTTDRTSCGASPPAGLTAKACLGVRMATRSTRVGFGPRLPRWLGWMLTPLIATPGTGLATGYRPAGASDARSRVPEM